MSSWPSNLPQTFDQGSYRERRQTNTISSRTNAGPGKSRRRFTAVSRFIEGSMTLTIDESAILDAFFDDVTQGGSLPFTWTHPRTGVAVQCQFAPGTQLLYEDEEGGEVITQFTIEVLP